MSNSKVVPIKATKETIEKYKIRFSDVKASEESAEKRSSSILGTFEGKCCDSNVFNNNDMHLSRELFEKLIASDEYKRAMQNHHYIGYLGHPNDSDCQDFEHACIVMKDMWIDDEGEIWGKFDLIDTPVGRIVKAFIDAGVNFGISIRGLGDVDGNGEVDPDQFIFRGYDLVTFPAYDDCIPEFKAIAASTDAKKQAQYKKICASIDANLKDVKSAEALEIIKEQLPDDSEEFIKVDDRIRELNDEVAEAVADADNEEAIALAVADQKLAAMTELYLDAKEEARELEQKVTDLSLNNQELIVECSTLKQKHARLNRLVANQLQDANATIDEMEAKADRTSRSLSRVQASLKIAREQLESKEEELKNTKSQYDAQVLANTKLKQRLESLTEKRNIDRNTIKASEDLNLKYQHKIEANSEAISQKDSEIEELKSRLSETVAASEQLESKASNLDERNGELLSRVEAAEEMVLSYQQAYADMYANALGVCLTGLPITASTSVEELRNMIKSGTSTAGIPASTSFEEVEGDEEYLDDENLYDDAQYSAGLVTM